MQVGEVSPPVSGGSITLPILSLVQHTLFTPDGTDVLTGRTHWAAQPPAHFPLRAGAPA